MGQSTIHSLIVAAGMVTLGAAFGGSTGTAEAAPIVLAETVILHDHTPQGDACTEFWFRPDYSAVCVDDDEVYDADHYVLVQDTDYPTDFYLVVWQ